MRLYNPLLNIPQTKYTQHKIHLEILYYHCEAKQIAINLLSYLFLRRTFFIRLARVSENRINIYELTLFNTAYRGTECEMGNLNLAKKESAA